MLSHVGLRILSKVKGVCISKWRAVNRSNREQKRRRIKLICGRADLFTGSEDWKEYKKQTKKYFVSVPISRVLECSKVFLRVK